MSHEEWIETWEFLIRAIIREEIHNPIEYNSSDIEKAKAKILAFMNEVDPQF